MLSSQKISLLWKNPRTGEKLTEKQKSIVEAHEKGHVLRPFHGMFFSDYFNSGFETYKLYKILNEKDYEELSKRELKRNGSKPLSKSNEQLTDDHIAYLFSGEEIAERMSQLKNYFGMKATDIFTKEHLDYAQNHYREDIRGGDFSEVYLLSPLQRFAFSCLLCIQEKGESLPDNYHQTL